MVFVMVAMVLVPLIVSIELVMLFVMRTDGAFVITTGQEHRV